MWNTSHSETGTLVDCPLWPEELWVQVQWKAECQESSVWCHGGVWLRHTPCSLCKRVICALKFIVCFSLSNISFSRGTYRDIDYYGVMRRQKTQVSYYTQIPCSNEYIICDKAAVVKQNHELYLSFQAAPTSANHSVPVTSFIPKIHMKVYVC